MRAWFPVGSKAPLDRCLHEGNETVRKRRISRSARVAVKALLVVLGVGVALPVAAPRAPPRQRPSYIDFAVAQDAAILAAQRTDACVAAPGYASAIAANEYSLANMLWEPFRRAEQGWQIYAPLIAHGIGTVCPPTSASFARALAYWQRTKGARTDGVLTAAQAQELISAWQSRRASFAPRGVCPDPPSSTALVGAHIQEGYLGKPVEMRAQTLAAYRALLAAARREVTAVKLDRQALTIFSAYRSPEYDEARCERDGRCNGIDMFEAPHGTGAGFESRRRARLFRRFHCRRQPTVPVADARLHLACLQRGSIWLCELRVRAVALGMVGHSRNAQRRWRRAAVTGPLPLRRRRTRARKTKIDNLEPGETTTSISPQCPGSGDADRIWDLIERAQACMLIAVRDGVLWGRPMQPRAARDQNAIRFLTDAHSRKLTDIAHNPAVCLSFSGFPEGYFMSLAGTARVHNDRQIIAAIWSDDLRPWWDGPRDRRLRVLEITPVRAQFWSDTDAVQGADAARPALATTSRTSGPIDLRKPLRRDAQACPRPEENA